MPKEQEQEQEQEQSHPHKHSFSTHVYAGTIANLATQPFRVLMNRAAYLHTPTEVLSGFSQFWHTGVGWNLVRGVSSVSLQAWTKASVQYHYGNDTFKGKFLGWLAATAVGTGIATIIETPFIRKSFFEGPSQYSSMRFSWFLTFSYLIREAGFTGILLNSKDLPSSLYYLSFFTASGLTGIFHKFATWDATADIEVKKGTVPNFKRDGLYATLRNLAYGAYTHPSFTVPYPKPVMKTQLAKNFIHLTCHPNMLLFRSLLLGAYYFSYNHIGLNLAPKIPRLNLSNFFFYNKEQAVIHADTSKSPKLS